MMSQKATTVDIDSKAVIYCSVIIQQVLQWSHRLTVRTAGFHPVNRSSILRGITILHEVQLTKGELTNRSLAHQQNPGNFSVALIEVS